MTGSLAQVPLNQANPTPVQPAYRRLGHIGGWMLRRLTRQDWGPATSMPKTGGIIVVANHISNFDPPVVAHFLIWNGRWPRTLGKSEIWKVPLLGRLATACGQIPVERNTSRARNSLVHAEAALAAGECVLIYPEGTRTADPELWPMTARPGAARLALKTGCPVVPVGQWGAQDVMPGKKLTWPRFFPRKTMHFRVGEPVDLSDLAGHVDAVAVAEANDRIMSAITALVGEIRGEEPPADRFDIRLGRRVPRSQGR
ncbi:MAG: 1-acyl-sn-glycerol-3-phosphate acyltransferase [Propionibacteriaceae bacterium]|nr:1-acyl-sn-glycerol-3-phosphate acyltransferase [Propionibacteriaceae bacterium]